MIGTVSPKRDMAVPVFSVMLGLMLKWMIPSALICGVTLSVTPSVKRLRGHCRLKNLPLGIDLRRSDEEHILCADAHDRGLVVHRGDARTGQDVDLALCRERVEQRGEVSRLSASVNPPAVAGASVWEIVAKLVRFRARRAS